MVRRAVEKSKPQSTTTPRKRGRPKASDVAAANASKLLETAQEVNPVTVLEVNVDSSTKEIKKDSPISPKSVEKVKIQAPDVPQSDSSTSYIHIVNLVRPFTLGDLHELLITCGPYNKLNFWINNIKSSCYVKFDTNEGAETALRKLDGYRWPDESPKTLKIHYANLNKMFIETNDFFKLGRSAEEDDTIEEERIPKIIVENVVECKKSIPIGELFKKTVCEPHIYWLTNESEKEIKLEN